MILTNTTYAKLIHIDPERQRKTFNIEKHQELVASIESKGLLHAVILRAGGDGELILVAGERRLRAIEDIYDLRGKIRYNGGPLSSGQIPYTLLSEMSALEVEEAELEENIRREDLTWQERSAATAKIASLRERIAVERGEPPPTHHSLAEEILDTAGAAASQTIRKQLITAKFLGDKDVASAPTLEEAFKVVKKKERDRQYLETAARVPSASLASKHTIHNGDSIAWMKEQPSGQFLVILTDPPYGMGADEFGDSGGITEGAHKYDDSYENWSTLMAAFAGESFRLAAVDAHTYCFCDFSRFSELRLFMVAAGWNVFRTPLIWFKPSGQRAPWPTYGPQRKYECILYAIKGKLTTNVLLGDVLTHSPDENLGHMAQKPVSLFTDLLKRSYRPGAKVLDPFAGSGPCLEAGHGLGMAVSCIEEDLRAYGMILGRLEKLK